MEKYYLYRHIRLDKNQPFYIGIGTKPKYFVSFYSEYTRAFDRSKRNTIWKKIVSKTNYEVEILFESDNYDYIKQKETEFVKLYGRKDLETGCLSNLSDGGEGLLNPSKITYDKVQATKIKNGTNKCSEEHRKSISKTKTGKSGLKGDLSSSFGKIPWNKGIACKEETKEKIKRANTGRKIPEEQIAKMRANSQKGKKLGKYPPERCAKLIGKCVKPVLQFTKTGEYIQEYPSVSAAALSIEKGITSITEVLSGRAYTAGGFKWQYKIEKTIKN